MTNGVEAGQRWNIGHQFLDIVNDAKRSSTLNIARYDEQGQEVPQEKIDKAQKDAVARAIGIRVLALLPEVAGKIFNENDLHFPQDEVALQFEIEGKIDRTVQFTIDPVIGYKNQDEVTRMRLPSEQGDFDTNQVFHEADESRAIMLLGGFVAQNLEKLTGAYLVKI